MSTKWDKSPGCFGVAVSSRLLPALLSWFKDKFTGPGGFNAKHLGKLSWFLGMAIDQHADLSVTIHQTAYIEKMLDKFLPSHASSREQSMPCNPEAFQRLTKSRSPEESIFFRKGLYLCLRSFTSVGRKLRET